MVIGAQYACDYVYKRDTAIIIFPKNTVYEIKVADMYIIKKIYRVTEFKNLILWMDLFHNLYSRPTGTPGI